MTTWDEAVSTLDRLVDRIHKRQVVVQELEEAYEGKFRLNYASKDFEEFFADRYRSFSDNWCGIVPDAPHERLEPIGIRLDGTDSDSEDKKLWGAWIGNDADAECDMALLNALIQKRSYGLVWGDDDEEPVISFETASQAIVDYDPGTRVRRSAAKVWGDETTEYATLYLPDEVWKMQRPNHYQVDEAGRTPSGLYVPAAFAGDSGWVPRKDVGDEWYMDNPLGKVPMVEIPNRPRLGGLPMSDISGTLAMQHAINLLWAQLFANADEATLGQRLIIGAERPVIPVLDENGQQIGTRPVDLRKESRKTITWIENPQAKVDQWQAAKLDVFTAVIEIMVGHIAAQTRTPAHYLLIGGTIANVSGDAMKALETGLVKRTEEKTLHFGRGLRDMFELIALVRGNNRKAKAIRRSGKVLWKDVENRSDGQRADSLSKKRQIGYPLRYLLEQDGLPPDEVERVMQMAREEATDPILSLIKQGQPGQGTPPEDTSGAQLGG